MPPQNNKYLQLTFTEIQGLSLSRKALLCLLLSPELGGIIITGNSGTGKSALVKSFAEFAENYATPENKFFKIPSNITNENLFDSVNLIEIIKTQKATWDKGLLGKAENNFVILDDLHIYPKEITDVMFSEFSVRGIVVVCTALPSNDIRPTIFDKVAFLIDEKKLDKIEVENLLKEIASKENILEKNILEKNIAGKGDKIRAKGEANLQKLSNRFLNAKDIYDKIEVADLTINKILSYADQFNIKSNRAIIFACLAAKAHCALRLGRYIEQNDIEFAVVTVFAPRAETRSEEGLEKKQTPQNNNANNENTEEATREDNNIFDIEQSHEQNNDYLQQAQQISGSEGNKNYDTSKNPELTEQENNSGEKNKNEQAEFENEAEVPTELFGVLDFSEKINLSDNLFHKQQSGFVGSHGVKKNFVRGRYIRSVSCKTQSNRQISIISTLRQAMPYQVLRGSYLGKPIIIQPEDLRTKQFVGKSGTLFIFCVDASGSMAQNRIQQTKGAIIKLLKQAYISRDRVSLVVFRNTNAEVILNPTSSIERAKREIEVLPTGGGTPLAEGLLKSLNLAVQAKRSRLSAVVILLSDGRANIPMNKNIAMMLNEVRQSAVRTELERVCSLYKLYSIKSMVIDTRAIYSANSEASHISKLMSGEYYHLPIITSGKVVDIVKEFVAKS